MDPVQQWVLIGGAALVMGILVLTVGIALASAWRKRAKEIRAERHHRHIEGLAAELWKHQREKELNGEPTEKEENDKTA